jgi:hypothetical protein
MYVWEGGEWLSHELPTYPLSITAQPVHPPYGNRTIYEREEHTMADYITITVVISRRRVATL